MVVNYVIQYLGGSDFPFEVIENNVETGSNMVGSWGYGVNETTWNGPALYSLGKVQQVNRFGIVVNNHLPTDPEGGEAAFPIKKYNRAVPLSTNMNVYFIDVNNSRNPIVRGTIMDINEGDKIFMRHRTGNADVIIVYR